MQSLWKPEESVGYPGTGVIGGRVLPTTGEGVKQVLWQEQYVLLIAEPPHQSPIIKFHEHLPKQVIFVPSLSLKTYDKGEES